MAKLESSEIERRLAAMPGWELKDNAIVKLYRFENFPAAIDFVNRIAVIAESSDHHPDIGINYTRVTFTCSTHSAGGVTEKDFRLAGEIEAAFNARSGQSPPTRA
jgi:4a-hydroxytetrahydrobiopterin dehydratase